MNTLDLLITSRVKKKILRHFMTAEDGIQTRELGRLLNEDPGNVARYLREIAKYGLVVLIDGKYYSSDVDKLTILQQLDSKQ